MIPADTALQVVSILLYSTSSVRRIGCEESGGAVPRFWLKPWAGLFPGHRLIGRPASASISVGKPPQD